LPGNRLICPEILAPAGNLEKLKIAVAYGADAVYLGGKQFGMRAGAGNFTLEEMAEGVSHAHNHGVRVYVTVNIFCHNHDLVDLPEYLDQLANLQVDGLIFSDPAVLTIAREVCPHLKLHLSTQANVTNWQSASFWVRQGVSRIVVARELSLSEIEQLRRNVEVELEAFVHGAMCISYSGRCLLSSYLTHRSANRGDCAHPCRWRYALVEENRPGDYLPILEDGRGTYIMSSRDLCMINHIPQLINVGLTSWKIEGRMKSIHYVATVVKAYRQARNAYLADPNAFRFNGIWMDELAKTGTRGFTTGFYFGRPDDRDVNYTRYHADTFEFVGVVKENTPAGGVIIEQRNAFGVGDTLEFVEPEGEPWRYVVTGMADAEGNIITRAPHPQQEVQMELPRLVPIWTLIRRVKVS